MASEGYHNTLEKPLEKFTRTYTERQTDNSSKTIVLSSVK